MEDFKQVLNKDWYGVTTVNSVGLAAVLALGVLMVLAPRRAVVFPMILVACYISAAQRIVIAGFDFDFLRILVLFGWVRVAIRCEFPKLEWNMVDTLMLGHTLVAAIAFISLRGMESSAISNRLGYLFTALGMYFLFRTFVQSRLDIDAIIAGFMIASIPVAVFFAIESHTGKNLFSIFGGVPEITQVRDGRLRVQGAFAHPIIAGAFWASILPMFAAKWWAGGAWRIAAPIGSAIILFLVYTTSSSTPVMAVLFAAIGSLFFLVRDWMRPTRWGILAALIGLHFVMNKPVWHLLARVTVFDSSTGWHRYNVIQQAVEHFSEWWMLGTLSTESWGGLYDITNEFVLLGINGGALSVLLFSLMIAASFGMVGRCRRISSHRHDRPGDILAWSLGVSLFVHLMSFIAVSYFGQIRLVWYLLIAMIASGAVARDAQPLGDKLFISGRHTRPLPEGGGCMIGAMS